MSGIIEYFRANLPIGHNLGITAAEIKQLVRDSGAEPWHIHAVLQRSYRRHACVACDWLASSLPHDAVIFETACGSGANLVWLAKQGFYNLYGIDISDEALCLCRELARLKGITSTVWTDNALSPSQDKTLGFLSQRIDAVLSLTWLYYVPGADLGEFLKVYRPYLKPNGIMVFDMVTHSFDSVRNNQYHTDDWKLPIEQRRPSEYKMRFGTDDVRRIAESCGYTLQRSISLMTLITGNPQRAVHMLRRNVD